jgi:hypothetical protein
LTINKRIYQKILEMTADAIVITSGRCCDTQEFFAIYFLNYPVDGSNTVSVTVARWCRAAIYRRLWDFWSSGIFQTKILHVFGCFVVFSFRISTPQSECSVSAGW